MIGLPTRAARRLRVLAEYRAVLVALSRSPRHAVDDRLRHRMVRLLDRCDIDTLIVRALHLANSPRVKAVQFTAAPSPDEPQNPASPVLSDIELFVGSPHADAAELGEILRIIADYTLTPVGDPLIVDAVGPVRGESGDALAAAVEVYSSLLSTSTYVSEGSGLSGRASSDEDRRGQGAESVPRGIVSRDPNCSTTSQRGSSKPMS